MSSHDDEDKTESLKIQLSSSLPPSPLLEESVVDDIKEFISDVINGGTTDTLIVVVTTVVTWVVMAAAFVTVVVVIAVVL